MSKNIINEINKKFTMIQDIMTNDIHFETLSAEELGKKVKFSHDRWIEINDMYDRVNLLQQIYTSRVEDKAFKAFAVTYATYKARLIENPTIQRRINNIMSEAAINGNRKSYIKAINKISDIFDTWEVVANIPASEYVDRLGTNFTVRFH